MVMILEGAGWTRMSTVVLLLAAAVLTNVSPPVEGSGSTPAVQPGR